MNILYQTFDIVNDGYGSQYGYEVTSFVRLESLHTIKVESLRTSGGHATSRITHRVYCLSPYTLGWEELFVTEDFQSSALTKEQSESSDNADHINKVYLPYLKEILDIAEKILPSE